MAKPKKIPFTQALEGVLLNIWGSNKDYLDEALIKKTRKALVEIRGAYRFKGEFPKKYPTTIQYRQAKNRAGYLAAFGQRHAYLTYAHLKMIEQVDLQLIPRPEESSSELVVTTLGAGAGIEIYGICLYYNSDKQRLRRLKINLVEKVEAWKPSRQTVFDKVINGTFPKLDIIPTDIEGDLTKNCITQFAGHYDRLSKIDILLVYNVLNEIDTRHSGMVWKNVDFLLRMCERPVLVLVMEPSVLKARPRVDWMKRQLAQSSDLILERDEEKVYFDSQPTAIEYEGTNIGLNDRLFGGALDGRRPLLQESLKRTHIACRVRPRSPIPLEQSLRQLAIIRLKRGAKGRFVGKPIFQKAFWDERPELFLE